MSGGHATVYSVAPGTSFLDAVATALIEGTLSPDGAPPGPLGLAAATVFLPTRRAGPAFARALHRAAGQAVLLPRIAGLGDVGDDEAAAAFASESGRRDGAAEIVSEAERRAVLADIAMEWAATTGKWTDRHGLQPVPRTPIEAVQFAIELAKLLDEMSIAGAGRDHLASVLPEDLSHLARNWEINLDFLTYALERWSDHLAARGLVERVIHRDRQLEAEAERLNGGGEHGLVVAAGSTGSVPAAARLMRAVARLESGAVILPGLDTSLDEASWRLVGPDHPQFGIKALIESIGIERDEVRMLGVPAGPAATVRARLVSEIMRPASAADLWVEGLDALDAGQVRQTLEAVTLLEADDEHLEARAVALMLRRAVDESDRLTALVTPDRALARRVAAELRRWRIEIDDSAGQPIDQTPPVTLLRLIAEAWRTGFAPVTTLALLKHPLTALGLEDARVRGAARTLELAALRGSRSAPSLDGLRAALDRADPARERHPVLARIRPDDLEAARDLVARLASAFGPLAALGEGPHPPGAETLLAAHIETAEAVAAPSSGQPSLLWTGEAGEALSSFLAEALAAARHAGPIATADFAGWLDQLMRGRAVRHARSGPANVVIWGPLEARLQHVDRLILAGLNEGAWPAETQTDPWLGRHMRHALGLDPPERRIGLQAHDVAQSMMAPEVVLTRAMKSGGTPAVPSRWVWRLKTLLDGLGCADAVRPKEPWLAWARSLDDAGEAHPCTPPRPAPPVAARPARLSVTRIETLVRDPYAIYASEVLKLAPLDPLDPAPDATDYGLLIHEALASLIKEFPIAPLPDTAYFRLLAIGEDVFSALDHLPGLRAYWWTRFVRIARWFVDQDAQMRPPGAQSRTEIAGRIELPVPGMAEPFVLTARADRIDLDEDGRATIIDYKTGRPPSDKQISEMMAPQLPLEAAIARAGGFREIDARSVAALWHLSLTGREPPGDARLAPETPDALADNALGRLAGLIAVYADPSRPYLSRVAPFSEDRAGDYDHLARVGEWSVALGRRHA